MGCGNGTATTCELSSDELGQRLLTRSVMAGFSDDKLVLSEPNQTFTSVIKWDSWRVSLERTGWSEGVCVSIQSFKAMVAVEALFAIKSLVMVVRP